MYYNPNSTQFDTPSPPASVVSVPPTNLELTSAHVKITPSNDFHSLNRPRNNMPTLSSSLPTSLASPRSNFSKASPTSRSSPPSQLPVRSTRSRAISDASTRPTQRRKVHSALDGSESGAPVDALRPPKQSLSTWQFFFTEWIQKQDGRKLNVAQAAKEAGKEYKLLSKQQKEVRQHSIVTLFYYFIHHSPTLVELLKRV
jgi:hypothetical protein